MAKKSFGDFVTKAWTLVLPLVFILVACTVLFILGYTTAQISIFSYLGSFLVVAGNAIYIVFWHSKSRWKDATPAERAKNLFMFKGD